MASLAERLVICGMHLHVGIEDEELRIDLMNQATYFLPHMLALSTSSPFWDGHPTGLKAYRPTIAGDLPRSGLPEYFSGADEWHQMLHQLPQTGLCDDPTKIWWDLRPSSRFPTLELRVCDVCTRLEDAITITALWQSILATLYRLRAGNQTWRRYRRTLVEENKWLAQRHGIGSELADYGTLTRKPFAQLLDELILLVRPEAERLGCLDEVLAARHILERGTSADRQLAVHAKARAEGAERARGDQSRGRMADRRDHGRSHACREPGRARHKRAKGADMTEIAGLDERTRTELEAAAFRTLVEHLRAHPEVQNIDLMNLAGFCRNCLSKWYRAAAEEQRPRRCPTTRRARSSTACPMTTGRRSTRPRRRPSSRPAWRRATPSTGEALRRRI